MKIKNTILFLLASIFLLSCGQDTSKTVGTQNGDGTTGSQAATYHYAFSGQLMDATTQQPIPNFVAAIPGSTDLSTTLINAMGSTDGVFHISRLAGATAGESSIPVILSAPGYQPILQYITAGQDCTNGNCLGSAASPISLVPLLQNVPNLGTSGLSVNNASTLATSLLSSGKISGDLASLLTQGGGASSLQNVVVALSGTSSFNPTQLIQQLGGSGTGTVNPSGFSNLTSLILPLLLGANPQVGGTVAGLQMILPYLNGLNAGSGISVPNSSFGQLIGGLLGSLAGGQAGGFSSLLANIMNLFGGANGANPFASLISGGLPFMSNTGMPFGFNNILGMLLQNPSLSSLSGVTGSNSQLNLVLSSFGPLLQGLNGGSGAQLSQLFNGLLQQGGASSVTNLLANPAAGGQLAALVPFLQPLGSGLAGSNAGQLTSLLNMLGGSSNPTSALTGLIGGASNADLLGAMSLANPGLLTGAQTSIAGKQSLAMTVLNAAMKGQMNQVAVTQDLGSFPGMLVSGKSLDILKLATLPQVAKILGPVNP